MNITGIYQIKGHDKNLGSIPVLGALGYTALMENGVTLYILHTVASFTSYELCLHHHDESCLRFYVKETDPVITANQLESIKRQIQGISQELVISGEMSEAEGKALKVIDERKRSLESPRPADEVLCIVDSIR